MRVSDNQLHQNSVNSRAMVSHGELRSREKFTVNFSISSNSDGLVTTVLPTVLEYYKNY